LPPGAQKRGTDPVDLEVTWLNGNTQTIQDVAVDQTAVVQ